MSNRNPADEEGYDAMPTFASMHEHVADLLGVYAIHAVAESEIELVEIHLENCEICQAELGQHFATAARLGAASVIPVAPRVWDNVLNQIRSAAPIVAELTPISETGSTLSTVEPTSLPTPLATSMLSSTVEPTSAPAHKWSQQSTVERTSNPSSGSVTTNNVVDFVAASKRLGNKRTWRVAIAAAVASAAITVPIVSSLSGSSPSLAALAKRVAEQPSSKLLTLKSSTGDELAKVVVGEDGQGYLRSDSLPKLSLGKAYQLWAVTDAGPVSLGMLGADPSVQAFATPETYAALAISVEESKGATAPTPPIASATV
jgi:Anti-sigma-K factor rskA